MATDIQVGDGIAALGVGDTFVYLWRDPAMPERVQWLTEKINEFAATQPGDVLQLNLILRTSTPPGAEARRLIQQQVTDLDKAKKLRHLVAAALGDSFWLNVVRTAGRMILFMAGKSHLLTLTGSMREALTAVAGHAGPATPGATELAQTAAALADALGVDKSPVEDKQAARGRRG